MPPDSKCAIFEILASTAATVATPTVNVTIIVVLTRAPIPVTERALRCVIILYGPCLACRTTKPYDARKTLSDDANFSIKPLDPQLRK